MKLNAFQRLFVLTIFLNLINTNLTAQTFINTPVYAIGQTVRNDTINVGPISFSSTNDNKVWALVRVDQDEITRLLKYDSVGHQLVNSQITQSYTLSYMNSTEIYACPDNGCVFATNRIHTAPYVESKAYRLNATGGGVWVKNFSNLYGGNPPVIISIKPTYYNTTLLQFYDSLLDINSSGQVINSRLFTGEFQCIPDSDIIVYSNSQISRQNFNGTIVWTVTRYGSPLYVDSNYFYSRGNNTITKFRNSDGSIVWQRIIPCFNISIKKDGGYLTCGAGANSFSDDVCNYDSSGNQIWCKNIPFPLYGYRRIAECTPNSFITGGATGCFSYDYLGLNHATGSFVCNLDSLGNGVIDSSDHFISGNGNDNSLIGFVDDAPFIAAAIGKTGIPRSYPNMLPFHAVFNPNWSSQFAVGINHKYSDVDGNGIIDLNDIIAFQNISALPRNSTPHWRKNSNCNSNYSSNSEIRILFEEDTLIAGDTATINIILGNPIILIDSIYSIGISIQSWLLNYGSERIIIPSSDFGDTAVDLMYYKHPSSNIGYISLLISKTNHLNASFFMDTIATVKMLIPSGYASHYYTLSSFVNAITIEGFPVSLNVLTDSAFYSDPFAGITKISNNNISIFPNPANDELTIESVNENITEIKIYSVSGQLINTIKHSGDKINLKLTDFPKGCYSAEIITQNGIVHKPFVVIK